MIDTLNPQIADWILDGKLKEALVGDGKYFVPSVTYHRHHNQSLILRVLFRVAKNQGESEKFQRQLSDVLLELSHDHPDVALATMNQYSVIAKTEYQSGLLLQVDYRSIMQMITSTITPEQFSIVTLGATLSEITTCVLDSLKFLDSQKL